MRALKASAMAWFPDMHLLRRWIQCWILAFLPLQVSAAPPSEASEAVSWLSRIHQAASRNNFKGTFMVSGGGVVSSARIAHFWEGGNQYEHIESLDGHARHVFRQNEWVHTVWPQTHVVQIEQRDVQGAFPGLLSTTDARVADFYDIKRQLATERVAGYDADVLLLRPRDAYRFGYRLWAEKSSGLLLRADVWSEPRHVLETAVFSEVTIGVKPQPEVILRGMKQPDGYRVARVVLVPTQLEAEGWILRQSVPGFYPVSCVKRTLQAESAPSQQVVQAVFSDGLTHVSIFIEPFDAARHLRNTELVVGATHTMAQRQGGTWMTVVGDVPVVTLRAFLDGLSRRQ